MSLALTQKKPTYNALYFAAGQTCDKVKKRLCLVVF